MSREVGDMEPCTTGRHHFTLRGVSHNGRSYRFRCTHCQIRAVVFRNSFWRSISKRILWLPRNEESEKAS